MPNVCQCLNSAANVELSQLRKLSPSIREFSLEMPARSTAGRWQHPGLEMHLESILMLSKSIGIGQHLTTPKTKIHQASRTLAANSSICFAFQGMLVLSSVIVSVWTIWGAVVAWHTAKDRSTGGDSPVSNQRPELHDKRRHVRITILHCLTNGKRDWQENKHPNISFANGISC